MDQQYSLHFLGYLRGFGTILELQKQMFHIKNERDANERNATQEWQVAIQGEAGGPGAHLVFKYILPLSIQAEHISSSADRPIWLHLGCTTPFYWSPYLWTASHACERVFCLALSTVCTWFCCISLFQNLYFLDFLVSLLNLTIISHHQGWLNI